MDKKVKKALEASINSYAKSEELDGAGISAALINVFESDKAFMDKVSDMDAVFDDEQHFEELREYAFDLLMINFFAADVEKLEEDYLDSEEWEAIEEDTIDRGSELLNILLYLRECADDEIEPSLEDFLKEFLLVEEDEFQDEYRIYEKVIANQILIESDFAAVAKVAKTVNEDEELFEIFYPLVGFFSEPKPSDEQLAEYEANALNKSLDTALYQLIINFNK
ncbi:hypothetical protein GQF61_14660 [Sphingobacterium sp. DK4209]|uniref:Uncharacterized protein n=1 Tax=Sphingobacterium zhuxiongii TaxID=2662364 RepID=A0A5Q0Q7B5_9SPHI|nr:MULTISPECIES: hypothetical protein [unclassified Sphingobacterium]MVZ67100.1 hypothetical protein [Sphingobacterium sp. DK4209]QGA25967.1 hypothetical protein GFH32_06400 [Sphingobacterium sp. dk4302]